MQAVICRFRHEDEFLSNRTLAERMGAENGFLLLGGYELDPGETVELKLLVRTARERTTIEAKVRQRQPAGCDADGRVWRYLVEVNAQDTVWLDMLDEKLRMRMRVTPNAA
jgi:hypothetical protein